MHRNPFIPYLVISTKLFKLEHELFQTNSPFPKKILLAMGQPHIDIPFYVQETTSLYEKFQIIRDKAAETEQESMEEYPKIREFVTKMDECFLAFLNIVNRLEKKTKDNNSLKYGEYNKLVEDYKRKKATLFQIVEKVTSDKKELLDNALEDLKKFEVESKSIPDQDYSEDQIVDEPLRKSIITEDSYNNLISLEFNKAINLYVDIVHFRDFFVQIPPSKTKEVFGKDFSKQIGMISIFPLIEFLVILFSLILAVILFRWWGIFVIPLILLSWFIIRGKSSIGKQEITSAVLLIIFFLAYIFFYSQEFSILNLWIGILVFLYFLVKFYYYSITRFIYSELYHNYKFFRYFYNQKDPMHPRVEDMKFVWSRKAD